MDSPHRKEQYLPTLKSNTFPKRWLFFDTETWMTSATRKGEDMEFRLGYAIYVEYDKLGNVIKRKAYVLNTRLEFFNILQQLDKTKKKLMVVAHNIKFDLQVTDIPFQLWKAGYETEPPIQNGMVFLWTVKMKRGSVQFIDTVNFVPTSLEKIGNDLSFPKLDIDLYTVDYDTLLTYCIRDVEIVEKFITEFIRFLTKNNLGSFKATLAGQSLTTFRYAFMNTKPYISNYQPMIRLARSAYYGGRTEAFFIGTKRNENFYYVDINSSYPNSMYSDELPIEFFMYRDNPSFFMLEYHLSKHYVIADVTIDTDYNFAPFRFNKSIKDENIAYNRNKIMQYRQLNGKLLFPVGVFRTVLHHDELLFALEHNMIKEVHRYSCYHKGEIFRDYVDFFYDMKQEATITGNKTDRLMAKLFLNSLYGKFGQRYHDMQLVEQLNSTLCQQETILDSDNSIAYREVTWFGNVFTDVTSGESTYSIPELAGAITAKSRMLLWQYMLKCGLNNVYYCDTDSLLVNLEGFCGIIDYLDNLKLGYLKLEAESKYLDIRNSKDYSFGEYEKIKGVPKNATQISADEWEYEWFEGWRTWRKRGARGNPKIILRTKARRTSYNKGKVLQNGNVEPYILKGNIIQNI